MVTITPSANPRPSDTFSIGDRLKVVYRKSKHYGRIARVTQVNNPRLSVDFEDGGAGAFVDFRYARRIPDLIPTTMPPNIHQQRTQPIHDNDEEDGDVLAEAFNRLAIDTAIAILVDTSNMAGVERAIEEQVIRIRYYAQSILRRRRNNNNREVEGSTTF